MPKNDRDYDLKYKAKKRARYQLEQMGLEISEFSANRGGIDLLASNKEKISVIRVEPLREGEALDREKLKAEMYQIEYPEIVSVELWIWTSDHGWIIEQFNKD